MRYMALRFCPKCRSIMRPVKVQNRNVLRCVKCGYEEEANGASLTVKTTVERAPTATPIAIADSTQQLPKTRAICPKCGNEEAYYWIQQTRAADEPPTRFYKCTRCGFTWREYE